jgi:hypothetical protein
LITQATAPATIGQLAGVSLLYVAAYTLLSWFVFADKEF